MENIEQVLMKRDKMSEEEARSLILKVKEQLGKYLENKDMDSAEKICEEYFGLEPDYIHELI